MDNIFNINVESDSDDDFFEEMLQNTRREKIVRPRPDYLNEYDEEEFRVRFRLSKDSTLRILDEIIDRIEHPTNWNDSIPPMKQLLLTLRYFATGNMLICLGDFCGVHKSTACRIVKSVSDAIAHLRPRYVKLPQTQNEILHIQRGFYEIAAFPKVVGCIDCTHVKIKSPGGDDAEVFRNRKNYFSLNVQAVCNSQLCITDIVARWAGASHDQTIFNNSVLKAKFEMRQLGDSLLLGDSGYGVTDYLMTPIAEPGTDAERLFNESLVRTRNTVERCFGVWKRRFPVLQLGIRLKLDRAMSVIIACAVLHNIASQNGEEVPYVDPQIEDAIDRQLAAEALLQNQGNGGNAADIIRNNLIQYFHNRLHRIQ